MNKAHLTKAMKEVIANMSQLIKDGKTDDEIITDSITDKIGDKECTEDLLKTLLTFAKADDTEEKEVSLKMFGNKDKVKKYGFPSTWSGMVVVRESVVSKIGPKDSDVVEIPSSVQVKPFDTSLFDMHVKNGMFKNKKVEILHDPR